MSLSDKNKAIQAKVGVAADGIWGDNSADAVIKALGIQYPAPAPSASWGGMAPKPDGGFKDLTVNAVNYCGTEEGIVLEAYKDSGGVWTWAMGVTNASGHQVYPRYLDKPQPLQDCVNVSVWLMRQTYLPAVLRAFTGYALAENELAAALSFQWNTGAIENTSWVGMVKSGDRAGAEKFLRTHYLNGGTLQGRRDSEANLFFKGVWPVSAMSPQYPVSKPSYSPSWGKAVMVDLRTAIKTALAA